MSDAQFRAMLDALGRDAAPPETTPPKPSRVAVLGAGPVGQLLACQALAKGAEVSLHSVYGDELSALAAAGGITVRGAGLIGSYAVGDGPATTPRIRLAASADAAIRDADVIFVATPAAAHATYAGLLASSLQDGQLVVLVPGRFLGAVDFARALHMHLCSAEVTVADLDVAPYLATQDGAQIHVHALARQVALATLPVEAAEPTTARLRELLPMLRAVDSPLVTAFSSVTGVVTVAPLLTNTAALEGDRRQKVLLRDLIVPGLSETVIADLDRERRAVAFHFGVHDLPPAATWLRTAYGDSPQVRDDPDEDVCRAIRDLEVFDDFAAVTGSGPRVIDDVPFTLVPLADAGRLAGVPTPVTDTMIALASSLAGADFARQGRTLGGLGLAGQRPEELRRRLATASGRRPHATTWRKV